MLESPLGTLPNDTLVGGRYRVGARLARGGMATVYRAEDMKLSRTVALKVLNAPKETGDPGQFTARLKMEAEALARLNHRHIVTVHDYGEMEDGGYYLVLEYVDGGSLSRLIRGGLLPVDESVKIVLQVARALRFAHAQGIIHRDVKPGNILLTTEEGERIAKLVDFGLVKFEGDQDGPTEHGLILGSAHCMAPEQIRGIAVDARTDIYGLGVVFFRLLTGRYPFNGDSNAKVIAQHIHKPVEDLAEATPELAAHPGLQKLVLKCLSKAPAGRYQSANELILALKDCAGLPDDDLVSASIEMSSSTLSEILQHRTVLVPGLAMILGGVVVLLMMLVSVGTALSVQSLTTRLPQEPPGSQTNAVLEEKTPPESDAVDAVSERDPGETTLEPTDATPEPHDEVVASPAPSPNPAARPRARRPRPEVQPSDDAVADAALPLQDAAPEAVAPDEPTVWGSAEPALVDAPEEPLVAPEPSPEEVLPATEPDPIVPEPVLPVEPEEPSAPAANSNRFALEVSVDLADRTSILRALTRIETLAVASGGSSALEGCTKTLSRDLVRMLGPAQPVSIYPRAMFDLMLEQAMADASREQVAAAIHAGHFDGSLRAKSE